MPVVLSRARTHTTAAPALARAAPSLPCPQPPSPPCPPPFSSPPVLHTPNPPLPPPPPPTRANLPPSAAPLVPCALDPCVSSTRGGRSTWWWTRAGWTRSWARRATTPPPRASACCTRCSASSPRGAAATSASLSPRATCWLPGSPLILPLAPLSFVCPCPLSAELLLRHFRAATWTVVIHAVPIAPHTSPLPLRPFLVVATNTAPCSPPSSSSPSPSGALLPLVVKTFARVASNGIHPEQLVDIFTLVD
ncbi:unnamed protein product [Closterium sp. NIES-53]